MLVPTLQELSRLATAVYSAAAERAASSLWRIFVLTFFVIDGKLWEGECDFLKVIESAKFQY